ncbi:type I polyketide synthase [Flavobacterium branchiicola]|uniref:Beta-ketoacyl synthase N-terminal-like domain-containing protein n=1 Tax=Flavobacterium branchiicola TaxID=1114875 RepID=A0ABV9PII3_9FLAO|nr:type I polyketide synthase [Flavobacterium branchiicola]MBS7256340.1 acyltransferase domain-containing protein [Flavobacterium branchiicola]
MKQISENDIAIIGMSGRFPNAKNLEDYWQNLQNGVNSIQKVAQEQITASGIAAPILNHKSFVNASSKLEDAKYFDAAFFGISNSEAALMDPQIRLLLQTSWHAIEDAGYDISRTDLTIGNFCGMSTNSYLLKLLHTNSYTDFADPLLYRILNEKDFLATWISHKLNLTGPVMTVQTACSTSLLAVHLACQSLLNRECDMALAGGASFDSNENVGYIHTPESIYSKDGVCRPFDKEASGTVSGDGVGTIVLKRAIDAVNDKDYIYAIIKGTAINNDGANKQSYTSPGINSQRDVILEASAVADISLESIGMIEAHGTGTLIGDPIEVAALTEAFREYTNKEQFCAIGSVKGNIGHLDAAAGIAAIIKAALCVNKGILVPSINFSEPNPALKLDSSPFYVSQNCTSWPDNFEVRRAGVSSFGVGGTNVHVIVEESPTIEEKEVEKRPYVATVSSFSQQNLNIQKKQLADYIDANPNINLANVEYTTIYGRKGMPYRFSVVYNEKEELINQLKGIQKDMCYEGYSTGISESIFMFPGQGSQYANMTAELYHKTEAFKKDMDFCFDYLKSLSNTNFKEIIFSDNTTLLDRTENTQIALFIVEYCLAKELLRTGIKPNAIIGHSLGEYTAACIVGCITIEEALKLVFHRGRLMGNMPEGDMILVRSTEDELKSLLIESVSICAYNADDNIVVGGKAADVEQQSKILALNNIEYKKLKVSHAYHTKMMENVLASYDAILSQIKFKTFDVMVFSTYTGDVVAPEDFCSKEYWLNQIINPVKFSHAVKNAVSYFANPVFIEIGPGNGLSSFVKSIFNYEVSTVNLLSKSSSTDNSLTNFYEAKAILCAKGVVFNLPETHTGKRVPLTGYAFSKNRFWKPKVNVSFNDFQEVKEGYHSKSEKYSSDRLRTSIEIELAGNEVSDEILKNLNNLNTQYIQDIKKLFSSQEKVTDRVEVLFNELLSNSETSTQEEIIFNQKRNSSTLFVEPETATEKSIAEYWGNVLGYAPVGIQDNYFEVGGNSLLATKLLSQLSDEFEITLSFRDLSECASIKELAAFIESKKRTLDLVEVIDIESDINNNYIEI